MSCICYSVVFHMKFPRVVYVMHMPRADLRFAALSRLPVAMKQSFSLRCDLLVNLLRITRGERLLCITSWLRGHQQEGHCTVGHIVACDTSSPSIERKSRKTRHSRYSWSPKRKKMLFSVRALICSTKISMHEWYKRVRLSALHSSVCDTVAAFERDGIIPRRRQAKALPLTVLSLFLLATAQ